MGEESQARGSRRPSLLSRPYSRCQWSDACLRRRKPDQLLLHIDPKVPVGQEQAKQRDFL